MPCVRPRPNIGRSIRRKAGIFGCTKPIIQHNKRHRMPTMRQSAAPRNTGILPNPRRDASQKMVHNRRRQRHVSKPKGKALNIKHSTLTLKHNGTRDNGSAGTAQDDRRQA